MQTSQDETIRIYRIDTFPVPKVQKTDQGFLEGEVVASRTGIFNYYDADGKCRKELRHPEDVLKEDSLKTLKMIPVTDDHPQEFVDANNASALQKGFTGESYRTDEDGNIVVRIKVTDSGLINKILSGRKAELSLGYSVALKKDEGTYKGERYDYRQTDIVYNHLAVVEMGRAGRNARFRLDSKKTCELAETRYNNDNFKSIEGINMSDTEKKLDHEVEVQKARFDALTNERDLLKHKLDTAEAKSKALESTLASVTKERDDLKQVNLDSIINERAIERTNIAVRAAAVLGEDFSAYTHHSNREIMEAALKRVDSKNGIEVSYNGASDEYVKGVFDKVTGAIATKRNDTSKAYNLVAAAHGAAERTNTAHDIIMAKLNEKK
jgi:hypothetical protein